MTVLILLLLFTSAVTGGVIYRMRGGAPDLPRPLEQTLFCHVFIFVLAAAGAQWWFIVLPVVLAVVATLTGHGQYFPSMAVKAIEPETLDFIVKLIFGRDPRTYATYKKWRNVDDNIDILTVEMLDDEIMAMTEIEDAMDAYGQKKLFLRSMAGMAVTGGAVTLAPGFALMFSHFFAGAALALSGFVIKPLAYYAGHKITRATEAGEYLYGGALWFCAVLIAVLVVT